jgi:hypothetical protein
MLSNNIGQNGKFGMKYFLKLFLLTKVFRNRQRLKTVVAETRGASNQFKIKFSPKSIFS